MWDIILEKFNFDVSEGRKGAILGHMSDLYIDYSHKLKNKYFDSKATYQLRLRNKPKLLIVDEWKYLVNLWSGDDFQVQFDQLKEQQKEGEISLNDDDIFEKVCGAEKYGYLRAYGPGKNISEYFGGRPTKI
ncbi:uncharacterized protein [Nicotiana tomentosiformis]|uniref:uncharacterized protein isoform X2 n=1 Tax=Nicotiana tomentosiformis TaxID=4098 RepID=UPI00388C49B0